MTKKAQRRFRQMFIDSWTQELQRHDFTVDALYDTPDFKKLEKAFKNKRKRILWNITRAKNLKKQIT
jgi:tRNA nucleotidyltransferase/poly(A) polymerase